MANSNSNKTKNWIYRLRHLRIRRASVNARNTEEFPTVVFRRSVPPYVSNNTECARNCNNFRKSLRKMHTRVKSVFRYRNADPNSRHSTQTTSIPTSSTHLPQSRVTLNSTTAHVENIYTLEPVKKEKFEPIEEEPVLNTPSPAGETSLSSEDLVQFSPGSLSAEGPQVPPRKAAKRTFPELSEIQNVRVPKVEVVSLSKCYWYWGPISRTQAEDRLKGFPDGAFLIRDSSSDRYIFSLSFRSCGRTMHTRIELSKSGYSLFDIVGYHSIIELVDDALSKSKSGIYCYTKSRDDLCPNYPVRLTLPVSRYDKVPSLKYLSRFVIRQCININDTEKLPLPLSLINYLQEDGRYF